MHSLDSGFHSLDSGFQYLNSGFQIGCGFWIPGNWPRIRIPPMFGFWIAKLLKVGFWITVHGASRKITYFATYFFSSAKGQSSASLI